MDIDKLKSRFAEKLDSRNNYDIFGNDYNEHLHWGKLFIHLFGEYYSIYRIAQSMDNEGLINCIIKHYSLKPEQIIKIEQAKEDDIFKAKYKHSETLMILKEGFTCCVAFDSIHIMYGSKITEAERNELIQLVANFRIIEPVIKRFYMVQQTRGDFNLFEYDVKPFDGEVETHYNDDFSEINNLIFSSLQAKDKNGIILLHGKYGTGKTYYLRHLINKIDRKFIYFPLNMMEAISSPEFLPFISEQENSVLILEDCESLLVSREDGKVYASALSNLLNLGDGLLADTLSINVICTFNAGLKKIDDAILRKGRLLARYEFKELEVEKARALAIKLGKNHLINKKMTVADIYNLDQKSFENEPIKTVGFNTNI